MQYITEFHPDFEKKPLSYSSLKAFQKSPQHFVEYRTQKKEPTAAMAFGSLVDCLILTPDDYSFKFAILPECDRRTKAGKEIFENFCQENKGRSFVSKSDDELAKFLAKKTFDNAKAKELLSRVVRTQDRMQWIHKPTGLPVVAYKDMTGDSFIGDLKTANDGSPNKYSRSAIDLGYPIQAGCYLNGEKTLLGKYPDFFHLVVETVAPYNVSVYKMTNEFIEYGKNIFDDLMQQVKFCAENDLWYQGYEFHSATGYHHLDLPGWMKKA